MVPVAVWQSQEAYRWLKHSTKRSSALLDYTALTVAKSVPPYASRLPAAAAPFPADPTAAPFTAAYTPAAPLSAAFAPLASPAGTWTLRVVDLGSGRERCVRREKGGT